MNTFPLPDAVEVDAVMAAIEAAGAVLIETPAEAAPAALKTKSCCKVRDHARVAPKPERPTAPGSGRFSNGTWGLKPYSSSLAIAAP